MATPTINIRTLSLLDYPGTGSNFFVTGSPDDDNAFLMNIATLFPNMLLLPTASSYFNAVTVSDTTKTNYIDAKSIPTSHYAILFNSNEIEFKYNSASYLKITENGVLFPFTAKFSINVNLKVDTITFNYINSYIIDLRTQDRLELTYNTNKDIIVYSSGTSRLARSTICYCTINPVTISAAIQTIYLVPDPARSQGNYASMIVDGFIAEPDETMLMHMCVNIVFNPHAYWAQAGHMGFDILFSDCSTVFACPSNQTAAQWGFSCYYSGEITYNAIGAKPFRIRNEWFHNVGIDTDRSSIILYRGRHN